MSLTFFESIKSYVGFTDESSAALRELHPVAQPFFVPIVDDFYAAIEAHPGASAAITGGQAQIERLKQTLIRWIDKMLLGPHDEAYYELRARIGRVHVRIALPQQYMFTAMDRIRVRTLDVVRTKIADPAATQRIATALNQIIDLELAIMLETYREDLMQRERLRVDLEVSEARHRELVESMPALVLALDERRLITTWNRQLEKVTGYSRTEMLGTDGSNLAGADERPGDLPVKRGGARKVRWSRAEVSGPAGSQLVYAVGIDVTDEEEILKRLLRAERLAAVGTLAAGLAHEVRNPLNSASLQLTVLERRLARGEGAEATTPIVGIIKSEIARLEHLVRDFLAFAKPSPLDLRPVDVRQLLEGVAELIRPEAESSRVTVAIDTSPSLPLVAGDSQRLWQVVLNLTRNALEAMQERGGRLILRSRAEKGVVDIEVEDDGPGFADDLPVFDAFFTTKDQGTGLGLSLAHRIVTDHGGTIRVQSGPGRTCFSVSLPVAAATTRLP